MKTVNRSVPDERPRQTRETSADRYLMDAERGKTRHASRDNLILEYVLCLAIEFFGEFVDPLNLVVS